MIDDNLRIEIDCLKKDIYSDNEDIAYKIIDKLAEIGGDEIIEFLIPILDSESPIFRKRAAFTLQDIKDNRAVEPLFKAIFKKENFNYNGVLVYVLNDFDCHDRLVDLFKILFYLDWECKQHAYHILSSNEFEFTKDDISLIIDLWKDIQQHPEKCPSFEDKETFEMIQDCVDGYSGYLNED